ncbi:hypothetical protein K2X33_07025 [bacterium]|nr:hypothetical protein [bacterium]
MRSLFLAALFSLSLNSFAALPDSVQTAEEAFVQYEPVTQEGMEYFSKVVATAEESRLVGEMLLFAKKEACKKIKESRREGVTADALQAVELWAVKYARYGQASAQFMRMALLGFPGDKSVEDVDQGTMIKGLLTALQMPDDKNPVHDCLTGACKLPVDGKK